MLDTFQQLAASAFMQRLTLLLNHVLAGESAALARLRPHSGRFIRLQMTGWPALLPPLPDLTFAITPAGLLEWIGADAPANVDLRVTVDASNPARSVAQGLSGQRPAVDVSGDAALATDVSWLMDNLRWDVQDDLARVIGDAPAHELARLGGKLAAGMRDAVGALAGLAARVAGGAGQPEGFKRDAPTR
jgi:ubiquinone biosynthesis protein UbiJ